MGRHSAPYEPGLPPWARQAVLWLAAGTFGAFVGTVLRAVVPWL